MAKVLQILKCQSCGHIVEVIHDGAGQLTCCNQPMAVLDENTTDAAQEKHVPVIEKIDKGYKVKVGSVAHPMLEEHYIEWIELVADGTAYRKFLKPGDAPEVTFHVDAAQVNARELCNLHGLWKG